MPQYPEDQTNGRMFTRHWVGEPKWLLASQSEFDGLAPSQIVRYANAEDRGFGDTESQHEVAARLDATPDADNLETNPRATELDAKGVTVDAHRYVVDPLVEQHQYLGLYTAGPVRHVEEPTRDGAHKRVQQVLTRTFCAGHGYFVDELGRYHPVWKTAGGGWTGVNPDKHQVVYAREDDGSDSDSDMDETLPADFTPDMVREYATADEALMAHRPWLESKLSPYMALHPESFPNTFVREVYWREFTHESIAALEELGSDRARLERVVAYHFTEKVAPQVLDAHCRLDPQTNTVIFVCSLMYVELGEPQTPDDLLDLPCIVAPCTRDTLRMFGWNQLRDGEGYRYTHVFKWPRLKDTPAVRAALEFVQDNKPVAETDKHDAADSWILGLLARHDQDEHPGWASYENASHGVSVVGMESDGDGSDGDDQADNTGRLVTNLDTPRAKDPSLTIAEAQFYRIAQQKCDIEQDGSLSFSIVLQKTEWHGADDGDNYENGGTRQLASVSASEGWGKAEHRVIPSVPRENAIPTLLGIHGSTYRLVVEKRQTEGEGGHSDVSFQEFPLYNYGATRGPDDPDHTPPNVQNPFGIDFDAVRQGYNPYPRPSYHVTYEHVAPSAVGPLIGKIKSLMGGDPAIDLVFHTEGYYTVSARGTGRAPRHIREWLTVADWYHHETVEQWLGVTVERGPNGKLGFYADDEDSDSDTDANDWHSIDEIRGDLDANWMGSDASSGSSIDVTTGIGASSHTPLVPQPSHADSHGNGWSASGWTDPDTDEGNAGGPNDAANTGDSTDKPRSHVITSVRPHINEDGTWNFVIHRNYPHQRVHYWETRQARKKGDWRPVYHAEYRNWPSRKAIFNDLVVRFSTMVGVNVTGEDYTWHFNPNVNVHGLVDAADVTLAPVIWNTGKKNKDIVDEGLTDLSQYKINPKPARARAAATKTSPSAAVAMPGFEPLLGHYFNIRKTPIYTGQYRTEKRAWAMYRKLVGKNPLGEGGSEPHKTGNSWVFKVVLAPMDSPTKFVYNGEYPGRTSLTIDQSDLADLDASDIGEGEDRGTIASEFNEHLADVSAATGVISRATWEEWFQGGADAQGQSGNNGTTPAGGGNGGGNSNSSGSGSESSGSGSSSGS